MLALGSKIRSHQIEGGTNSSVGFDPDSITVVGIFERDMAEAGMDLIDPEGLRLACGRNPYQAIIRFPSDRPGLKIDFMVIWQHTTDSRPPGPGNHHHPSNAFQQNPGNQRQLQPTSNRMIRHPMIWGNLIQSHYFVKVMTYYTLLQCYCSDAIEDNSRSTSVFVL